MSADATAAAWAHRLLAPQAQRLARQGQLVQAAAWTQALLGLQADAHTLCLLGKVQAQQGQIDAARQSLQRALQSDSGHLGAAAALVALDRWRPGRAPWVALGVLVGALLVAAVLWRGRAPADAPALPAALPATLPSSAPAAVMVAPPLDPRLLDEFAAARERVRALAQRHGVDLHAEMHGTQAVLVVSGSVPTPHLLRQIGQAASPRVGIDATRVKVDGRCTVLAGDSLVGLSRRLYGDAAQWPALWQANRGRLSSPHALRPGQVLSVP
jgi:hypothetical protein